MNTSGGERRVGLVLPADAAVTEFPEPVRITGLDGSSWTIHGAAMWGTPIEVSPRPRPEVINFGPFPPGEPGDECEGAP